MSSYEIPSENESAEPVNELPVLPFEIEFVNKEEDAQYIRDRIEKIYDFESDTYCEGEKKNDSQINKEIEEIKELHKEKKWFTTDNYRRKRPNEQVEFSINDKNITFYNFNKEKELSESHIEKIKNVFKEMTERFPGSLNNIDWVLIEEIQQPSLSNDERFPLNGLAEKDMRCLKIMPRALDIDKTHRVEGVLNFEGTLVHEVGHFIEDRFLEEWRKHYQWREKREGEIAPGDKYPVQPNECIDDYAKKDEQEDICDSLVAYIYNPKRLKEISPKKFSIIESIENKEKKRSKVSSIRIDKSEIKLPEIKAEIIKVFLRGEK